MLRKAMVFCMVVAATLTACALGPANSYGREVVAYWGFLEEYAFGEEDTKFDFAADVDATTSGDANLQGFRGDAADFDQNGGTGFPYTSPVSGVMYEATRTIKWDDVRGGGDDFDIGGVTAFLVDKSDGMGPVEDSFGNDGLLFITLNGTGWKDFQVRFDIEGTPPDDLPTTFDIFYRLDGSDPWIRDTDQNNIPLMFVDLDPPDEENQIADSGMIALNSVLDGQTQIELIIGDFAEMGNSEMEIDNVEISAEPIPEPATFGLILWGAMLTIGLRRHR